MMQVSSGADTLRRTEQRREEEHTPADLRGAEGRGREDHQLDIVAVLDEALQPHAREGRRSRACVPAGGAQPALLAALLGRSATRGRL